MYDDLLEQVTALKGQRTPFVLATVVACKPPTSAKPGAKAIVQADGSFNGWVGGSCAQPIVTQEALKALKDGRSRLLVLAPNPDEVDFPLEGVVAIPMVCQSEGTLAIYLEPFLPKPELVVIGQSPMARSLVTLGRAVGFYVCVCDPSATAEMFPHAEAIGKDLESMKGQIGPRSYVVVATTGHYDEEAIATVVGSDARYIGLVASPRRGRAVMEYLRGKGIPNEALQRVKYPAGLDVGALTPEEIALSILTEIVQKMRAEGEVVQAEPVAQTAPPEATDPVCRMTVNVAEAQYISARNGDTYYFCCLRCKETFDREPDRYAVRPTG